VIALTWLRGLVARRRSRLLATAAGVAVAVALLASIGTFLSATTSKMTARAIARVPIDWQVEAQPGADPRAVLAQVQRAAGVKRALPVTFAPTTGLRASSGGSSQATGPGRVLGLPGGYAQAFPGEIRTLSGSATGVLLAQQTAANLHARPGDTISVGRPGTTAARLRVDGVIDLPAADSLFQKVGAPVGAQPQAPPDNVVLLPAATFRQVYGGVARARPELIRTQVHTTLEHNLPGSPSAAYTQVAGKARNLETRLTGGGLVGDNLGTALDQARRDAQEQEQQLGVERVAAGLVQRRAEVVAHEPRAGEPALELPRLPADPRERRARAGREVVAQADVDLRAHEVGALCGQRRLDRAESGGGQ